MKNVPKRIYLQVDADGETPNDFNELVGVSWCSDRINANDIEFILNENTEKREKKSFCSFTVKSSIFCSRCHDCRLCELQPKND